MKAEMVKQVIELSEAAEQSRLDELKRVEARIKAAEGERATLVEEQKKVVAYNESVFNAMIERQDAHIQALNEERNGLVLDPSYSVAAE